MASMYLREFGFTFFLRVQSKWVRDGKDCVLQDFFKAQRLDQEQIGELLTYIDEFTLETQKEIIEVIPAKLLALAFENFRKTPAFSDFNEQRFEQMVEELSPLIDRGALDIKLPVEEPAEEENEEIPYLAA